MNCAFDAMRIWAKFKYSFKIKHLKILLDKILIMYMLKLKSVN